MGNSVFWWVPHGASVVEIDFGRKVSGLDLQFTRSVSDAVPLGGSSLRHDRGGTRRVRIVSDRIVSKSLIRELRSLETFLLHGGRVGFCIDKAKTWGSWATATVSAGDTTIAHSGNEFTAFSSGSMAAGDEVSIENPNPAYRFELSTFTSDIAGVLTIGTAIRGDFDLTPVFVRYADFFPTLRLPEDAVNSPLLTSDRRLNWTLDVTLEERPGDIEALFPED